MSQDCAWGRLRDGGRLEGERYGGGCWFGLPAQILGWTLAWTHYEMAGGVLIMLGCRELVRTSVTPKTVIGRRSHFEKIQFTRTEMIGTVKLWEDNNRVDQRHSVIN